MKKLLFISSLLIAGLALTTKAQTKIDTTVCNTLIKIQTDAYKLISASNAPTDKSDVVRNDLKSVILFFEKQKQELIAEDKKQKEKAKKP